MKNKYKKLLLTLCLVISIFSFLSIDIKAKEIIKDKNIDCELRTDVLPKSIYIEEKTIYSSFIPKKHYYYYYEEVYEGVLYRGNLTLVEYQYTGDGYIGVYFGYIYR